MFFFKVVGKVVRKMVRKVVRKVIRKVVRREDCEVIFQEDHIFANNFANHFANYFAKYFTNCLANALTFCGLYPLKRANGVILTPPIRKIIFTE